MVKLVFVLLRFIVKVFVECVRFYIVMMLCVWVVVVIVCMLSWCLVW